MTETTKMIVRETAERVVEYEREEGYERDDAFRTPQDVCDYADRFGWLDDVEDDLSELADGELEEFEVMVTDMVIELLFGSPVPATAPAPSPTRDWRAEVEDWDWSE